LLTAEAAHQQVNKRELINIDLVMCYKLQLYAKADLCVFIQHLLRQLAATYKYTVKYSCTINYIYIQ